jgi:DNA-binding NtrC family response regulator
MADSIDFLDPSGIDEKLHAAEIESLERRIMELALEQTGSRNGAIFLWDEEEDGLAIDFHVVNGLMVNLPQTVLPRRTDNEPVGIAMWVYDHNTPYLCEDTASDPHYAPYFQAVRSMAAVPIPYQGRAIGVISASSREPGAFDASHMEGLVDLAASAAKFLRRAQLSRNQLRETGRVLLIKGLSPQWLEVERQLEQTSPTSAPVLIRGESGTGKELVANAIHFNSRQYHKPFVAVNCAAIPEQLLESTLFGHVRGAFTGATFTKLGEFQKADGGTLFLDEVGDLSMALQPKVLRAVEQGEVQPLGSNDPPKRVDVRLICATNRDLLDMVRQGTYREDLYYRLSLVTMVLPPLRSYRHQLRTLSKILLKQAVGRHNKKVERLSPATLAKIEAHDFPGNMRELEHVIEHAVIMCTGSEIQPEDLPATLRTSGDAAAEPSHRASLKELRDQWLAPLEREYLINLLRECEGNVARAAGLAGVNKVTLYRLLKRHELRLTRDIAPK